MCVCAHVCDRERDQDRSSMYIIAQTDAQISVHIWTIYHVA